MFLRTTDTRDENLTRLIEQLGLTSLSISSTLQLESAQATVANDRPLTVMATKLQSSNEITTTATPTFHKPAPSKAFDLTLTNVFTGNNADLTTAKPVKGITHDFRMSKTEKLLQEPKPQAKPTYTKTGNVFHLSF